MEPASLLPLLPPKEFFETLRLRSTEPAELKAAFVRYDIEGTGFLSVSDVRALVKEVKKGVHSDEHLDQITKLFFDKYDDGDGELSYKEFEVCSKSTDYGPPHPCSMGCATAYATAYAIGCHGMP